MTNTSIDASSQFAGGNGGAVTLHTGGSLTLADSFIGTGAYDTSSPGNGGDVTIIGKDVTFNNSGIFTDVSATNPDVVNTPELAEVRPGAVNVTGTNSVTFSGSLFGDPGIAVVNTTAFGTLLDGGSVTITGKTVNLLNGTIDAGISHSEVLFSPSSGNGGTIEIRGNNVNLSEFNMKSDNAGFTESSGRGGIILLRSADSLSAENIQLTGSRISVASVTSGGGGSIEFNTRNLTVSEGSVVQTVSLAGLGASGTIVIEDAENVTIQSGSQILADIVGGAEGPLQGAAGDILIETQNLTLLSGGQIGARNLLLSTGNAGNITVHGLNGASNSILIDGAGSGIFSTTEGSGKGGNINLSASSVTLLNGANGAQVSSTSTGSGIAGDVTITAGNQFTMTNSKVTTEAKHSGGGVIKITTNPDGTVQLTDSTISASVLNGNGGGGSVNIDPQSVVLINSQILANAVFGPGGNINITTNLLLPDTTSVISASSQFGQQGTVIIQSPVSPASGRINPLGQKPLVSTSLVSQRCAALAGGTASSFTVAGRDSLPAEPGEWVSAPLALAGDSLSGSSSLSGLSSFSGETNNTNGIDETNEIPVLSLRRIAPSGFLTQSFAANSTEGCAS
jgi:large exoprotein involved in heme utilization and adhesion